MLSQRRLRRNRRSRRGLIDQHLAQAFRQRISMREAGLAAGFFVQVAAADTRI